MKLTLLICFIICTGSLFGQKREQYEFFLEKNYLGLHFDDDFLFIGNRDEQYTGGLEIEFIHASKKKKQQRHIINPFSYGQRYWTHTFGSYLFTPYNVSDSLIILNDRPYSSLIYTTVGYTAYDEKRQKKLTTELYLGIMGSELPGKIQDKIHTIGESPPASGWDNRISKDEIFTPNLKINYQSNFLTIGRIDALIIDWIQLGTIYELNAGFFANNFSAGIRLSTYNQNPLSESRYNYKLSKNSERSRKRKLHTTFYLYPRFEAVIQNASLQGLQWIDSPYKIPTDEMNRFVWDIEAGMNLTYGRFHLSYLVRTRSKEFFKYREDWHSWAGISLGFSF